MVSNMGYVFFYSDNPKKWCLEHFIQWRALKMAVKVKEQLSGILSRINVCYLNVSRE